MALQFLTLKPYMEIFQYLKHVKHQYPQDKYYKIDIVVQYNNYKMFTAVEERGDLPSIGFVEGMACGCAFIGLDDPMYRDIGLIPNFHYISYDGTVKNLMENVRYYQTHSEELERIAKRGHEFVCQNFKAEVVYGNFLAQIESYVRNDNEVKP